MGPLESIHMLQSPQLDLVQWGHHRIKQVEHGFKWEGVDKQSESKMIISYSILIRTSVQFHKRRFYTLSR